MNINQIIVLKESRNGEGRVALTPSTVSLLARRNWLVMIESGAGKLAGFTDEEYIQAGAKIIQLDAKFPSHTLVLRVKCPTSLRETLENGLYSSDTAMMGFLDPLDEDTSHIAKWKSLGMALIPLELLPLVADDPKNAQAAMSRFAGRLALLDALGRYQGPLSKKVTIIGTGPAGIEAALAARTLCLPVQLFGRQERFREKIEAMGAAYYVLPEHGARDFIKEHLHDQTVIMTAARVIGKKSPLLIDEDGLALLPAHSIVVDLSTGEGGNVAGSKSDQVIVTNRGVSIINISGYPKAEPREAAIAFANCMVNLLLEITTPDRKLNSSHPLLNQISLFG